MNVLSPLILHIDLHYSCYWVTQTDLIKMPLEEVFEGSISGYDVKVILNSEGLIFFLCTPHRRTCYQARLPTELTGKSL